MKNDPFASGEASRHASAPRGSISASPRPVRRFSRLGKRAKRGPPFARCTKGRPPRIAVSYHRAVVFYSGYFYRRRQRQRLRRPPMIVNAAGTLALSSFRWVDAGSLWSYALGEPEPKQNNLSDAKWLTLVQGAEDYFALVHHFEDGRVRLTSHSYRNVSETISSIELQIEDIKSNDVKVAVSRLAGEGSAWSFLPRAYVVRPFEEAIVLLIDWSQKATQIQSPSWYKGSYDTMYQGILNVTEVPGSSLLIFSIQRDSEPLLFDPTTSTVVQKLTSAH